MNQAPPVRGLLQDAIQEALGRGILAEDIRVKPLQVTRRSTESDSPGSGRRKAKGGLGDPIGNELGNEFKLINIVVQIPFRDFPKADKGNGYIERGGHVLTKVLIEDGNIGGACPSSQPI